METESQFISPVGQWRPNSQTTLTAELELGRRDLSFDRGFGNSPLFLEMPIHTNYAEPDARLENESGLASVVLEHGFENGWELRSGMQASWARTDALWYPYGFNTISDVDTRDPQVNRRRQRSIDEQTDASVMTEMSRRFDTGALGHRVLLGADYNYDEWDFEAHAFLGPEGFPANLPISLYDPVHGMAPNGPLEPYDASRYDSHNIGLYLQDEIQLGSQWRLLLGGRYDRARSGAKADYLPVEERLTRTDEAFSPRVGITWTPSEEVSLYGSWAQSFLTEPFNGMLREGNLPSPSQGEQTEIGAKFSLMDGRLEPTLALFDIRRRDGLVSDPDDFNYVIQVGEQRSRGWEVDVPYAITPQWRLLASYTQLKAEISEHSDSSLVGNLVANAPRSSASFWSSYDFAGQATGLSLGLGAIYVGERQANTANSFELPSYTRWDANVIYRFGEEQRYRVQMMVQNLGDKRYYDSGGAFVPTFPGAPRSVLATVGMTF